MINMQTKKIVYNGFHKVAVLETEMKGKKVQREQLLVKSAVAAIVTDDEGKIGLVTQYRPIIGKHTKEIPAGLIDKEGLTPEEILIEELYEECGIEKNEILSIEPTEIPPYFMMGGSSDATLTIFRVKVTKQCNKIVEDADVDEVEWVDLATYKNYLDQRIISDGKGVIAYYVLLNEAK